MSTQDDEEDAPEASINGDEYVPFRVLDVVINDVEYVPESVPANVVINGLNYVLYYGERSLVRIDRMLYLPLYQWRPIETVPLEGRWLLLLWPAANPFLADAPGWREHTGHAHPLPGSLKPSAGRLRSVTHRGANEPP
jgi:hypothetical protein